MPTLADVEQHRDDVEELVEDATVEVVAVFAAVETADQAREALLDVLPDLVLLYGLAASALGAEWYDRVREQAGAGGSFRARVGDVPEQSRAEALARWAVGPLFVTVADRVDPGATVQTAGGVLVPSAPVPPATAPPVASTPRPGAASARTAPLTTARPLTVTSRIPPERIDAAISKATGGLQRVIADADRESIRLSTVGDPDATGWVRINRPDSCDFCWLLAERRSEDGISGVYTEETVRFASHDFCRCVVAPAIGGDAREVEAFRPSPRNITPESRAAVYRWLKENPRRG